MKTNLPLHQPMQLSYEQRNHTLYTVWVPSSSSHRSERTRPLVRNENNKELDYQRDAKSGRINAMANTIRCRSNQRWSETSIDPLETTSTQKTLLTLQSSLNCVQRKQNRVHSNSGNAASLKNQINKSDINCLYTYHKWVNDVLVHSDPTDDEEKLNCLIISGEDSRT